MPGISVRGPVHSLAQPSTNHATLRANHMSIHIGSEITPLLSRSRMLLGLTQKGLGELLEVSLRTAHRWDLGKGRPSIDQVRQLAAHVFPLDATLAAQLAEESGATLEGLGLVQPAPPPPLPPPAPVVAPGPPPRAFPPITLMVDSILLYAIDAAVALGTPGARESVPTILRAAFSRARGLGLTTEEIDDALSKAPASAPKR